MILAVGVPAAQHHASAGVGQLVPVVILAAGVPAAQLRVDAAFGADLTVL